MTEEGPKPRGRASCLAEWLNRLKQDVPVKGIVSEDIVNAIHEAREKRTERIIRAVTTKRD
jgi:hypothetical protein